MGKKLPKSELLKELEDEYRRLAQVLESLRPRALTAKDRNEAGWAIKDVITHLTEWIVRNLAWYEAGRIGDAVSLPEPGKSWKDLRQINESIFRQHRRKGWRRVHAEFESAVEQMVAVIKACSDAELTTIGHYAWTGPSWTVSDFFRANSASHFRWARKKIRKWLRAN